MLKIAITGNIAAGKSAVEKILKDNGFNVFDTDEITHSILDSSEDVRALFNDFDVFTNNKIDRKKISKIVFSDKNILKKLEAIVHPLVKNELLKIFKQDYEIIFVSVPQLFEAGFDDMFDKIVFVTADENIRLQRLMKRNNLTKNEAILRINAQMPEADKINKCTYVLENNGTIGDLTNKLNKIQFNK